MPSPTSAGATARTDARSSDGDRSHYGDRDRGDRGGCPVSGLLQNAFAFEYHLVAKDRSWMLCFSHHGVVFGAGQPVRSRVESLGAWRMNGDPRMSLFGRWFYVGMGAIVLVAVAVGFGRTYAAPMARGTFAGPTILHVHGALALSWVLLFLTQPLLIRLRKPALHRRLGRLGLPLAVGLAATMVPAGVYQATRDAAAGAGPTGISSLLGTVTSALLFVSLVTCGIVTRRDREAHARWLLLATLVVAWPAWFRWRHWFPAVPRPDIWFAIVAAYVWVGVAMLRDRVSRAAVHPVLKYAGTAVVLEQSLEAYAFDSPVWRATAQVLYGWLHA